MKLTPLTDHVEQSEDERDQSEKIKHENWEILVLLLPEDHDPDVA